MAAIECFMVEPTRRAGQWLRRFTYGTEGGDKVCPADLGHDAQVRIEDGVLVLNKWGWYGCAEDWPHDDPRWPVTCEQCGYTFTEDDPRQLACRRIFVRPETGQEYTLYYGESSDLPPGAMYYAADDDMESRWRGPEGKTLKVVLPDNSTWCIDGPSVSGNGWQRTGIPPKITVTPGILSNKEQDGQRYLGFLRDGFLVDE
jgi:hypothetical protein